MASLHTVLDDNSLQLVQEWREPRIKSGVSYIGLDISNRGVYTCTTAGHLRLFRRSATEEESSQSVMASLPMRLCDFHLSPNQSSFAYGGDEVDLSLWDAERAFLTPPSSTHTAIITTTASSPQSGNKRKKPSSNDLLHGEIWRAKNLPNDNLDLRQPVHVSSLAFLSSTGSGHQLVTGSRLGHVRRYDTRAARKPVANWTQFKSIQKVQPGCAENEILVSDTQSGLYSVDSRTGKILTGYKGISGAVCDLTSASSSHFASVSLDRFFRLHVAYPPPSDPKERSQLEKRGDKEKTPLKIFLKSTPTAVAWDGRLQVSSQTDADADATSDNEGDDNEWDGMDVVADQGDVDDSDDEGVPAAIRPRHD